MESFWDQLLCTQGWDTYREVLSDHFNREARILEMPELWDICYKVPHVEENCSKHEKEANTI